jgi:hypothetical protein
VISVAFHDQSSSRVTVASEKLLSGYHVPSLGMLYKCTKYVTIAQYRLIQGVTENTPGRCAAQGGRKQ